MSGFRAFLVDDIGIEGGLLVIGTALLALAAFLAFSVAAALAVTGLIGLVLGVAIAVLPPDEPGKREG